MSKDNNLVNNQYQGVNGGGSPIIPKNIQSNNQNQTFQNNTQNVVSNNSTSSDDADDAIYTPAVDVPGLDDLEDYVEEVETSNNVNTPNVNLNSNNVNSSASVNSNQGNMNITPNIQEQPQIDMVEVDDSFDNNSKNFSPNIDMTGLELDQQAIENEEIINPSQELGVDANIFSDPNSQIQTNTMDYGFDPFNKFDETTEENFLPGFDQNFYNPNFDDDQAFIPGIVPDEGNVVSNNQEVEENFIPSAPESPVVEPITPNIVEPVQSKPNIPNVNPVQTNNSFVESAAPAPSVEPVQPPMGFVEPAAPAPSVEPVQPPMGFVEPTAPAPSMEPVQPPMGFVEPTTPTPSVNPVQPPMGFVEPTIPTPNVEPVQPNVGFIPENKPIEPAPVDSFDNKGNDDLVESINSLDDYNNANVGFDQTENQNNTPFGNVQANAGEVIGNNSYSSSYSNPSSEYNSNSVASIKPRVNYSMSNFNSLLTPDKKIVTFIGTSKNGTSFLVNNLAAIFSSLGINTAILDMTHNKNSYYIYTKNDENLRKVSYTSIEKLKIGESEGLKVNKNLTVYTALPNDGKDYSDCEGILTTLAQNHSVVLIDCDFTTPMGYFALCQEIYLVQSLDILTIQPLTAFLRDLKTNNVLEPEKVRVVINKDLKVGKLTSKIIISGMSSYNDPSMSFMTELFNKDTVNYCVIPFDERAYSKYLEGIVNCEISVSGFSSGFVNRLKTLAEMIYPLNSKQAFGKNNQSVAQPVQPQNTFSNSTNNTLNKMKQNF